MYYDVRDCEYKKGGVIVEIADVRTSARFHSEVLGRVKRVYCDDCGHMLSEQLVGQYERMDYDCNCVTETGKWIVTSSIPGCHMPDSVTQP